MRRPVLYFYTLVFLYGLGYLAPLLAQRVGPGGLADPVFWCRPQLSSAGVLAWQLQDSLIPLPILQSQGVNHWLVPNFRTISWEVSFNLPDKVWANATLFTVYEESALNREEAVWSWQAKEYLPLLYTNKRLAKLSQQQYLNTLDEKKQVRLHTYFQSRHRKKEQWPSVFQLGKKPDMPALPINDWTGAIAECILFPYVLSKQQRQQVESYLAMKYGITLGSAEQPQDYLSSTGQVLWAAAAQQAFHHRVFACGKDLGSNWQQHKSQAAEAADLLQLSLANSPTYNGFQDLSIADQTFWLLGDNDASLDKWLAVNGKYLERQWLVKTHGAAQIHPTTLRFDLGRWLSETVRPEHFFLLIDRGASGNFSAPTIERIPLAAVEDGRFGYFRDILWDTDGSGSDHFTLAYTGANEALAELPRLRYYPNPTKAGQPWQWQLRLAAATEVLFTINDAQGRCLHQQSFHPSTYFAQQETALVAGVYHLHFRYGNNQITQKLIVQ